MKGGSLLVHSLWRLKQQLDWRRRRWERDQRGEREGERERERVGRGLSGGRVRMWQCGELFAPVLVPPSPTHPHDQSPDTGQSSSNSHPHHPIKKTNSAPSRQIKKTNSAPHKTSRQIKKTNTGVFLIKKTNSGYWPVLVRGGLMIALLRGLGLGFHFGVRERGGESGKEGRERERERVGG